MLRMIESIDRPTNNTLVYLTKVSRHRITRKVQLRDPFVARAPRDMLSEEALKEFEGFTRSFYTIEGHYANLWLYDRPHLPRTQDPMYSEALRITKEAFKLPYKVRSFSWDNLREVPFIRTSGAGWTYVGKKGDPGNHDLTISHAVGTLRSWSERIPTWKYTPDMAWTRTQLGTFDSPKIRNVWGKAFHNIILEGMIAYPLINAYQSTPSSPMIVGIHLYKRLPIVIRDVLQDGDEPLIGIGTDFKSFDTTPQPWMIEDGFHIIRDNIEFTDSEGTESFEFSKEFFINTPVITADGRMWLKKLGIPSSSYYTQIIGSIINHILISFIQLKYWGRSFTTKVLGDDSAFGITYHHGLPDLQRLSEISGEHDFTIHPHKVVVATRPDEMEFLGHVARGLRVDRDTVKMLRLALFTEYPLHSPNESLARMKGLLVDSALNWPLLNLIEYMPALYNAGGGETFPTETKNWLESVIDIKLTPQEIDTVKACY